MANLLALDLGTRTGYAVGSAGHCASGVWDLKGGRFEGGGMRYVRFRAELNKISAAYRLDQVVFEEVRRHLGTDAAHVYGGLMAMLTAWCEEHHIPYEAVPVATIKQSWTGKGNAPKSQMIAECQRRGMAVIDDNEADAVALFELKVLEMGEMKGESQ